MEQYSMGVHMTLKGGGHDDIVSIVYTQIELGVTWYKGQILLSYIMADFRIRPSIFAARHMKTVAVMEERFMSQWAWQLSW